MSMRRFRAVFVAVLLAGGVCLAAGPEGREAPLPDIHLTPIEGGEAVSLSVFRGRPVLLNFWASWCGPCRMELPELADLYNRLGGKGLILASVNVDQRADAARRFLDAQHLSLPVYRVPQPELRMLGVRSIPTSILLDPEGRVVRLYQGYGPGMVKELERLVEGMLASPAAPGGA